MCVCECVPHTSATSDHLIAVENACKQPHNTTTLCPSKTTSCGAGSAAKQGKARHRRRHSAASPPSGSGCVVLPVHVSVVLVIRHLESGIAPCSQPVSLRKSDLQHQGRKERQAHTLSEKKQNGGGCRGGMLRSSRQRQPMQAGSARARACSSPAGSPPCQATRISIWASRHPMTHTCRSRPCRVAAS